MRQGGPPPDLAELAALLGHQFADYALLEEALTHPSAEPQRRGRKAVLRDNDRLEFLGDRVLGLIVADYLRTRFREADAGELARRLNTLVRRESLTTIAESVELGRFLRMSRSERESGGTAKPAILADACEAVIAALYVDGGIETARNFVLRRLEAVLEDPLAAEKDAKTALQEWAAARGLPAPAYSVVAHEGPAHEPKFTVAVSLPGAEAAQGGGGSKRSAEQAAAQRLLQLLAKDRA